MAEKFIFESDSIAELSKDVKEMKQLLLKHLEEKSNDDSLKSESEVCKLLNKSKSTMKRLRDDGNISYVKIGSKIYYKTKDIESFIDKHYVRSPLKNNDE